MTYTTESTRGREARETGPGATWSAAAGGRSVVRRGNASLNVLPAARFEALLGELAGRPDEPVALDLRLPFCAVHCSHCSRDVHAAPARGEIHDYVQGLVDEIGLLADALGARRDVVQLRLGGGSANELSDSELAQLAEVLQRRWRIGADAQMAIDCDPRRTGAAQLQLMRGLGFREIGFGVVDLDPGVQLAIGRWQSAALVRDVCELARASGFEQVNLALMTGLPGQTLQSWRQTLDSLLALAPERIALHCYRHRPGEVPAQHALDPSALPGRPECDALARLSAEMLGEAGYVALDGERFVLDSDPLLSGGSPLGLHRNQLGFTAARPAAVLGAGAGAVSESGGLRFGHEAAVAAWRDAVRRGCLPVSHLVGEHRRAA